MEIDILRALLEKKGDPQSPRRSKCASSCPHRSRRSVGWPAFPGGRRRSSAAAVALIYLCAGGITIPLPLTTKS